MIRELARSPGLHSPGCPLKYENTAPELSRLAGTACGSPPTKSSFTTQRPGPEPSFRTNVRPSAAK
jgi:hypothetical protein